LLNLFRAYLFDCDGTIADSMPLHYNAWKKALAEWNCVYPEDLFYSWGGKPVRDIIADLNKMQGLNMPIESLAERKESLYLEQLPQLKPILKCWKSSRLSTAGFPLRWFRGAARESVVGSLSVLNLLDKFDAIVAGGRLQERQTGPGPIPYCCRKTRRAAKDCLVFEDTALGIQSATAAGMASVMVPFIMHRN
jgi:beta-phosphoglucomutase-like phosphatase (HAD superfamily)